MPESEDEDTSTRQAFTGWISKEGCSHAALFHRYLSDRTASKPATPTSDWPLPGAPFASCVKGFLLPHPLLTGALATIPTTHSLAWVQRTRSSVRKKTSPGGNGLHSAHSVCNTLEGDLSRELKCQVCIKPCPLPWCHGTSLLRCSPGGNLLPCKSY